MRPCFKINKQERFLKERRKEGKKKNLNLFYSLKVDSILPEPD